jgi:type IV pilus assembly protein PilV
VDRSRRSSIRPGRRTQTGVGLVEVLIATLVLAFGMLGLAGLQLWNLRANQCALERGRAVVQTHSIADAMRADRATAISGGFDIEIDATAPTGSLFADQARVAWRTNLIAVLGPAATGAVDCDGAFCTISVRWDDQRGSGDAQHKVETQVQL